MRSTSTSIYRFDFFGRGNYFIYKIPVRLYLILFQGYVCAYIMLGKSTNTTDTGRILDLSANIGYIYILPRLTAGKCLNFGPLLIDFGNK